MVLWSLAGGIELPPWIAVNILPCFLNGTLTSFSSLIRQNRSCSHPPVNTHLSRPSVAGEGQSEVLRSHWLAAAPHYSRASDSASQPLMYLCLTSADPNDFTHLLIGYSHARHETLRVVCVLVILTLVLVVGTRRSRAIYLRGINDASRAHATACCDAVRGSCDAGKQHTTAGTTISDRLWLKAIDARGGGGLMREVRWD